MIVGWDGRGEEKKVWLLGDEEEKESRGIGWMGCVRGIISSYATWTGGGQWMVTVR